MVQRSHLQIQGGQEWFSAFIVLTPIAITKLYFWPLVGINNSNPIDAFFNSLIFPKMLTIFNLLL
jgi:hypothetical protein